MNANDMEPKRRLPRAWRYTLLVLAAVALVAAFYAEENWRGRHSWERFRAELVKRGQAVDPASVIPPRIPEDQNFAATSFLAPLFDFLPGTQRWRDTNAVARAQNFADDFERALSAVKTPKIPRSNSWVSASIDLEAWDAALHGNKPGSQPVINSQANAAEAARGVLSALAKYEPVLNELREASHRPYSRFNLSYDYENPAGILLPHLAVLKRATKILQLRATAELAAGMTDQAFADMQLMFHLADTLRGEPVLISLLVRAAETQLALQPLAEGIGEHRWTEPQLSAMQTWLQGLDFPAEARRAMDAERILLGSGIIDYVRTARKQYAAMDQLGLASGQPSSGFDPLCAAVAVMPRGWLYFEKENYERAFLEQIAPLVGRDSHRVSPAAVQSAHTNLQAMIARPGLGLVFQHRVFPSMLLPALSKIAQKTAYSQAAADTALVACALERYHLKAGGYPEKLDALVPEFLAKLPPDVISGEPLRYHRTEDGKFVLYSVGWNQKDDGGTVASKGNGDSANQEEGDWVWR